MNDNERTSCDTAVTATGYRIQFPVELCLLSYSRMSNDVPFRNRCLCTTSVFKLQGFELYSTAPYISQQATCSMLLHVQCTREIA